MTHESDRTRRQHLLDMLMDHDAEDSDVLREKIERLYAADRSFWRTHAERLEREGSEAQRREIARLQDGPGAARAGVPAAEAGAPARPTPEREQTTHKEVPR